MKRTLGVMLSVLVIIIINALAFAHNHTKMKPLFQTENANQQLSDINKQLPLKNNLSALNAAVNQLESLRDRAKKCVERAESHLKIIKDLLSTTQFDLSVPVAQSDHLYLQDKKTFYTKELSQCRLFVYRSQEVLIDYKDKIQKLSTYAILSHSNPAWKIQWSDLAAGFETINFQNFVTASGFYLITFNQVVVGCILLLIGFSFAWYMRILCKHWLQNEAHVFVYARTFFEILSRWVIPICVIGLLSWYFNTIFKEISPTPTLEVISHTFLVYCLLIVLSKYLFHPSDSVTFFRIQADFGQKIHKRFISLLSWVLIGYLLNLILKTQSLSIVIVEFLRAFFVSILGVLVLSYCWSWTQYFDREKKHAVLILMTRFLLLGLFFAGAMLEWTGYHRLLIYAATGVLLTIILSALSLIAWHIVDMCYERVDDRKYRFSQLIYQFFGVRSNRHLYEFTLIRFSIYFFIGSAYVIAVMYAWQVSENWIDTVTGWLFSGFRVADSILVPAHLIFSLIVFSVILLLGRFIATSAARRRNFQSESDTQIAISTIIIYISFAMALFFALLVTGINFTNLAIIAGALSVGIGLGLQNIVNNFVSGLILLIEKPIKPGDRIVVGDTEGFVKKIRIRSTQIATLAKEDVIVPNAELIANKVTNFMFRDRFLRIASRVNVAYGSDVQLVKKILLEVAKQNENVVHDIPNEPIVLFKQFGDSGLNFELWCVIYDVNKKYYVLSELNFAIDAAFRQHKIVIPFPQREIHIRSNDGEK